LADCLSHFIAFDWPVCGDFRLQAVKLCQEAVITGPTLPFDSLLVPTSLNHMYNELNIIAM